MPRSLLIGALFIFTGSVTLAAEPSLPRENAALNPVAADTLVEIETASGRRLVGHLQPDSDTRTIVLRGERPGIVLTTKVPASSVRGIGRFDASRVLRIEGVDMATKSRDVGSPPSMPVPPHQHLRQASEASGLIQSLHVDASPANWDRDADLDGLRLRVTPVSAEGVPVAARGTLNVQLLARRFSGVRNDDAIEVVEEWTRQLSSDDFGPTGATIDLPFRKLDPERDIDVIPVGLLKARLGVSGQGRFEAPAIEFWLRPTSYIRDELRLHTGSRSIPR